MPKAKKKWSKIRQRLKAYFVNKKIGWWFIYGLVAVFALVVLSSKYGLLGFRLYSVRSGSMEPSLAKGSLVLVREKAPVNEGDIITFYTGFKNNTVTHRVIKIQREKDLVFYQTKGDANNAPDSVKVAADRVVGKVVGSAPYLGYIVAFTQTLIGVVLLILVPSLIIIIDEGTKLKEEWRRWQRKNKTNQKRKTNKKKK